MVRELISRGQVTGIEADMWLTSLAFLKNINKDMINEIAVSQTFLEYFSNTF